MGMTKQVRPTLMVAGTVAATAPRQRYDRAAGGYTDEVIGFEVTVLTDGGGQLVYRVSEAGELPAVLGPVAVVVEVSESREYGVTLFYSRDVTPDDLDRINSALLVKA